MMETIFTSYITQGGIFALMAGAIMYLYNKVDRAEKVSEEREKRDIDRLDAISSKLDNYLKEDRGEMVKTISECTQVIRHNTEVIGKFLNKSNS
jgi:hypothetical protein